MVENKGIIVKGAEKSVTQDIAVETKSHEAMDAYDARMQLEEELAAEQNGFSLMSEYDEGIIVEGIVGGKIRFDSLTRTITGCQMSVTSG